MSVTQKMVMLENYHNRKKTNSEKFELSKKMINIQGFQNMDLEELSMFLIFQYRLKIFEVCVFFTVSRVFHSLENKRIIGKPGKN